MKLSRTLAEKVITDWHAREGCHVHRAEASFRRIPVGGSCPTCHRRNERVFSVSHDLFGIFDGVSVARAKPKVWWQVTTVSRSDVLGPRGGSRPNFNNVSARKRKIEQVAGDFAPDVVLIYGATAVRQGRAFLYYFMVWRYDYATGTWALLPDVVRVEDDERGKPHVVGVPCLWRLLSQEPARQGARATQDVSQAPPAAAM